MYSKSALLWTIACRLPFLGGWRQCSSDNLRGKKAYSSVLPWGCRGMPKLTSKLTSSEVGLTCKSENTSHSVISACASPSALIACIATVSSSVVGVSRPTTCAFIGASTADTSSPASPLTAAVGVDALSSTRALFCEAGFVPFLLLIVEAVLSRRLATACCGGDASTSDGRSPDFHDA